MTIMFYFLNQRQQTNKKQKQKQKSFQKSFFTKSEKVSSFKAHRRNPHPHPAHLLTEIFLPEVITLGQFFRFF